MEKPQRVVLKVSGEGFCPENERGISMNSVSQLAAQIAEVAQTGVQLVIVMGGGNILRGSQFKADNKTVQEATAHTMGMLATIMNGLALQDAVAATGQPVRLMTAVSMPSVAEPYSRTQALEHLEKGRVVIVAGGTGLPFVTTDTAAAQRALELNAELLLKATKVDGIYSDDPVKNPEAVFYDRLTYEDVRSQNLKIMDSGAIDKCASHRVPIMVFNFRKTGTLLRAVQGEHVGTLVWDK